MRWRKVSGDNGHFDNKTVPSIRAKCWQQKFWKRKRLLWKWACEKGCVEFQKDRRNLHIRGGNLWATPIKEKKNEMSFEIVCLRTKRS